MRVLIVGAGAIGTSIAYQLAARGAGVVVLERQAVACAASGKSGGFLALDWCDGTPLMGLARRSFALHAELAGSLDGDWGYRVMTTYAGEVGRSSALTLGAEPEWLSADVAIAGQIGSTATTAQVHPAAFTVGMMRAVPPRDCGWAAPDWRCPGSPRGLCGDGSQCVGHPQCPSYGRGHG
jgi:glycine/D-amino acid oxidase-like deaminating enzyme